MIKINDINLYQQFVKTIFKMRYKGSILGFLWVLLKPFFLFLMLFIIFSSVSGSASGLTSSQYAIYLLSGLIVYTFFSEATLWGMGSIMERASLILKINFKREIAVISAITMALINLGINMLIIGIVAIVLGVHIQLVPVLYVLFVCLVIFTAVYGMSFFMSIWLIHLRDLAHIMELVLQLLFYASAVFFPAEMVPVKYRFIVEYNPLAIAIQAVRKAFLYGDVTHLKFMLAGFGVSIIVVILGRIYFKKNVVKIAEYF